MFPTDSDTNSGSKKLTPRPVKEAEIATKRPDIFAERLIEKLNRLVSVSKNCHLQFLGKSSVASIYVA